MTEHPIAFNDEMVRALLAGRKTQTRRPVKGVRCPFGVPGDRLWVQEAWKPVWVSTPGISGPGIGYRADGEVRDGADSIYFPDPEYHAGAKWRSPQRLPRWASRFTLDVTDVRVERVQNISEADAEAEGIHRPPNSPAGGWRIPDSLDYPPGSYSGNPVAIYHELWDSIYAKKPGLDWDSNPWIWVVEFEEGKTDETENTDARF